MYNVAACGTDSTHIELVLHTRYLLGYCMYYPHNRRLCINSNIQVILCLEYMAVAISVTEVALQYMASNNEVGQRRAGDHKTPD